MGEKEVYEPFQDRSLCEHGFQPRVGHALGPFEDPTADYAGRRAEGLYIYMADGVDRLLPVRGLTRPHEVQWCYPNVGVAGAPWFQGSPTCAYA